MEGKEVGEGNIDGAGEGTLVVVTDAGTGAQTHKYPTAFEVKTCEDTQVKWMQITEEMKALIYQCSYATFVSEESEALADQQRVFQSFFGTKEKKNKKKKLRPTAPTVKEVRDRSLHNRSMHEFPTADSPIGKFAKLLQEAMGIQNFS